MAGNALHKLFTFSQPHVKHVMTTTFHEAAEEEVAGVPGLQHEAVVHLYRQAIRIRQGNQVDDVTALSIPEPE
jgi:hypothetical protein